MGEVARWRWWRCSHWHSTKLEMIFHVHTQHNTSSLPWTFSIYNHLKKLFIYVMVRNAQTTSHWRSERGETKSLKIISVPRRFISKLETLNTHLVCFFGRVEAASLSAGRNGIVKIERDFVRVGNRTSRWVVVVYTTTIFFGMKKKTGENDVWRKMMFSWINMERHWEDEEKNWCCVFSSPCHLAIVVVVVRVNEL